MILKGRGFRGGSDEKMRRMWFGLEIDVVGLPPLVRSDLKTSDQYCIGPVLRRKSTNVEIANVELVPCRNSTNVEITNVGPA